MLKLLAIVAVAGTIACQPVAAPDVPDPADDHSSQSSGVLPLERFRDDTAGYALYSGLEQPHRVVVRDAETWADLWAAVHEGMSPQPPVPDIDFAEEVVVAAALGTRPSGGYAIRIAGATGTTAGIEVLVQAWSPGEDCGRTAAITAPVDLVRLPRTDGTITFKETADVIECR